MVRVWFRFKGVVGMSVDADPRDADGWADAIARAWAELSTLFPSRAADLVETEIEE